MNAPWYQVLLAPMAGAASRGSARFAFEDAPWQVEITPWPEAWRPLLPGGMVPHGESARGGLSLTQLEGWIGQLQGGEAHEAALAMAETLTAHQRALAWALDWQAGGRSWRLDLSRPRLMGVVNVTPDSFSDGGLHADTATAVAHALRLAQEGADILDIGGESTRPGAAPVSEQEELARVIPVIRALASQVEIPIAVDTSKAAVMAAALEAGAAMVNDVTALTRDPAAAELLARAACPVVLMHMRGTPATMQQAPSYGDVVGEVYAYLAQRLAWCEARGISRQRLLVDPGIGFGKEAQHNLDLLRRLRVFAGLGTPVLAGVSRKRIVGHLTGIQEPAARDGGSHVLGALAVLNGARILRVHDVAGARQALAVAVGWMGE